MRRKLLLGASVHPPSQSALDETRQMRNQTDANMASDKHAVRQHTSASWYGTGTCYIDVTDSTDQVQITLGPHTSRLHFALCA